MLCPKACRCCLVGCQGSMHETSTKQHVTLICAGDIGWLWSLTGSRVTPWLVRLSTRLPTALGLSMAVCTSV